MLQLDQRPGTARRIRAKRGPSEHSACEHEAARGRGARYEWWTGAGKPWVADDSRAAKHFEYHHMIGAPHTFYNAGLKRYILPNYGSVNSNTK